MRKILILLSFFLLLLAGAVFFLPVKSWLHAGIVFYLKKQGVGAVSFEIKEVGASHLRIEQVRVGKEVPVLEIGVLEVTYTLQGLWHKKVNAITLSDVALRGNYQDGQVTFGTLDSFIKGDGESEAGGRGMLPFSQVILKQVQVAIIDQASGRQFFSPLVLDGDIQVVNAQMEARIAIHEEQGRMQGDIHYHHDIASGEGKLSVSIPAITFAKGGLQPDHLFPIIRGKIYNVEGGIGVKGDIVIHKEGTLPADLTVQLNAISATVENVTVRGVEGAIGLRNIFPLTTAPEQKVAIQGMEVGVPLGKGEVLFDIKDGNQVTVHRTKWQWGKGIIEAKNIRYAIQDQESQPFVVQVKGIALEDVLTVLDPKAFSATGQLQGNIPMVFTRKGIHITKGVLESTMPGTIRYRMPGKGGFSQEQVQLVLTLLENFHYDHMALHIESTDEKNMHTRLFLTGANPEVEKGRLVKLNITLKGNVLELLKSGRDAYSFPERIIDLHK